MILGFYKVDIQTKQGSPTFGIPRFRYQVFLETSLKNSMQLRFAAISTPFPTETRVHVAINYHTNKLDDANYYILRSILGLSKSNTYQSILRQAKMQTLTHRIYFQSLVLLYKCMKEQGPKYIQDFFKLREVRYNLRGSGTKLEQLPFQTKWLKNSFGHIASRLWNNLPAHVREADNLTSFKQLLSKAELKHNIYCT